MELSRQSLWAACAAVRSESMPGTQTVRETGTGSLALALLAVAASGCVAPPALPGVAEPGAAVRARLDPATPVTMADDGSSVHLERVTGRVAAVDSAGVVLLVTSAERLDGRPARELEGRRVRIPPSAQRDLTILTADARASEITTLALIGGIVAAVYLILDAAFGDS